MGETPDKPECFGVIEIVFSMHDDGLRHSPESCMACVHKTQCLRTAIKNPSGLQVQEEIVDRAYESKKISFLERWSKRKHISKIKKNSDGGR